MKTNEILQDQKILHNPLFITGHVRSGTNITNKLLDGHPEILTAPRTGKLHILRRHYFQDWHNISPEKAINSVIENIELNLTTSEKNSLKKILSSAFESSISFHEAVRSIILFIAELKGEVIINQTRWTEKNHNLEFYFANALRCFKGARLISVIRNPKDVWCSWKKMCKNLGLSNDIDQFLINIQLHALEEYEEMQKYDNLQNIQDQICNRYAIKDSKIKVLHSAYSFKDHNYHVLKTPYIDLSAYKHHDTDVGRFAWNYYYTISKTLEIKKKNPDTVDIIRYEDLVCNTEKVIKNLCQRINITFDESLLIPTECSLQWENNSSFESCSNSVLFKNSIGRYYEMLSNDEINIIDKITNEIFETAETYYDG